MFVPLRLEIRPRQGRAAPPLELAAVLNTGARPERAELVLPVAVARRLRWWPLLPEGTQTWKYEGPGSKFFVVHAVRGGLRIAVSVGDRRVRSVACDGVVSPGTVEVLVSARLISRLGIVVLDPDRGLWCFRDELGRVTRRSRPRQLW